MTGDTSVTGRVFKLDEETRQHYRERQRQRLRDELHDEITYVAWSPRLNWSKVGCTTNLKRRFSVLKTGCPDIRIIATFDGGDLERDLKIAFAERRIGGEWFDASPEHISEVAKQIQSKVA